MPEGVTDPEMPRMVRFTAVADEATDPVSERSVFRTNVPPLATDPASDLIGDFNKLAALDTLPSNKRVSERNKPPAVATVAVLVVAVRLTEVPTLATEPARLTRLTAAPLASMGSMYDDHGIGAPDSSQLIVPAAVQLFPVAESIK